MSTNAAAAVRVAWERGAAIDVDGFAYGPSGAHGGFMQEAPSYYRLLAGLAASLGARTIVEAGTHYGGSALSMLAGMRAGGAGDPLLVTGDVETLNRERLAGEPGLVHLPGDMAEPAMLDVVAAILGRRPVDILYVDGRKDRAFVLAVAAGLARRVPVRWLVIDDIVASSTIAGLWPEITAAFDARAANAAEVEPASRSRRYGMGVVALDGDGPALLEAMAGDVDRAVATFELPKLHPGLLHSESQDEMRLLYGLARQEVTGAGELVDSGCLVGAGTLAMARGLADRPDAARFRRRLHVVDRFRNVTPTHRRVLGDRVPPDGSCLELFLDTIDPVARFVTVWEADPRRHRWPADRPIELLRVELSRSRGLLATVFGRFAPAWIPGATRYVQRDFLNVETPWLQVAAGGLVDGLVPERVVGSTVVFRNVAALSAESLAGVLGQPVPPAAQIERVMRLRAAFDVPAAGATMQLVAARIAHEAGEAQQAATLLGDCLAEHGDLADRMFQRRLGRIRTLLAPPAADVSAADAPATEPSPEVA